ncbi:Uncharacterised protein [Mycobacteroides abscessus subsp. abscessus]|nr:Uncharacterised protein [Mycobacteroides abscessus subsp. abscessus]
MHCLFDGHERSPGPLSLTYVAQKAKPEVVEGHVSQVGAGIGEADLDTGVLCQLLEHLGPVVGNGGAPAHRRAVFEHQIEEGVHWVQAAAIHADLPERLTDNGLIRAGNDLGIEEVSVPNAYPELALVVLAKPAPILLVAQ